MRASPNDLVRRRIQAFEWYSAGGGKHWQTVRSHLSDWSDFGLTSMWLPPPTKGSSTEGTGMSYAALLLRVFCWLTVEIMTSGYDVYDLYDLGEFDQKGNTRTGWGNKEEFIDLIKTGKELGIITYM